MLPDLQGYLKAPSSLTSRSQHGSEIAALRVAVARVAAAASVAPERGVQTAPPQAAWLCHRDKAAQQRPNNTTALENTAIQLIPRGLMPRPPQTVHRAAAGDRKARSPSPAAEPFAIA